MNVFYRRLFFWLFFCLFLVSAPLAILFSQGYRFDQYKKIFIHSGSITIKSTPSSVDIFLNGELYPPKSLDMINNSITINGLRPGRYNLKISADGYSDWEKSVDVHSGISTEFWNIFLPKKNPNLVKLDMSNPEKYFSSPFGKKILFLKKNESSAEFWSSEIAENEPLLLFSTSEFDFTDNPFENAEWDSDEKMILVPVEKNSKKDFLIIDSEKYNESPQFLSSRTAKSDDLEAARWSPDEKETIYYTQKSDMANVFLLRKANIETGDTSDISNDIKAFDISSRYLYELEKNNILYKTDLNGKNPSQITLNPIPFSNQNEKARIVAYDENRQAVISESGELFVNNKGERADYFGKISSNAKSMQFSDDGKKLLFWSENEISVLFLRDWEVQPRRKENEIQQLIRFSNPVKNVFWYRDYEHVFFSTQNSMKLIELDHRDKRICFDITEYKSDNFLSTYDSSNGILFLLDESDGEKNISLLEIPEQKSFFE